LVACGGLDADGGIPDLDLQFGIGAHRSIFTHSIISGTIIEGGLYGLATLVGHVHSHLPTEHDSWWDSIERNRNLYLERLAQGMSAGIAYHLMVDATLQAAPYHDLPLPAPMEVHEGILGANAITEGADVPRKVKTFRK
jgi:hypothetical protein